MRHATSKIAYDQDLFHIRSLGFRGEALASIASVSKLTIETSTGDKAGTKLYMEGGEFKEEGKSTARKGTEITVCELFYNTPARLKYMKTIHTELGHITDLMNRYALAHPHIRFTLVHNDKTIFNSKGNGNLLQVISEIYGMQVARNMYKVEAESLDFHVSGFISKPEVTRSNRNFMTTIVNGRYIINKTIFNSKGNVNLLQVISEIYVMQVSRNMYKVESESLDFHVSVFISKSEVTRSNRNFMTTIENGRYIKSQALNFAITRAYD